MPERPNSRAMNEYALEIQNLSKTYSSVFKAGTKAVVDVSLRIAAGEVFALLGPNGAGKTTLILTVLGLLKKDSGTVSVFGGDIDDIRVKQRTGYLPENPSFNFPRYFTAYEYLDLHGSLKKMDPIEKKTQINDLLNHLALSDKKDVLASKYSKGMIQRLNIAQAFLGNPDLIFLDEPVLGLDPMGIAAVRQLIENASKNGSTVFINSHLLSEVEKTCDSAGILIQGILQKKVTMDELSETLHGAIIKISNMDEVKQLIGNLGTIEKNNLRVVVKTEADIEKVVRHVVESGAKVKSVVPQIKTLEQYFIEMVKKDDENTH
jgi:ABC-2 type transport system ATP-binding protein